MKLAFKKMTQKGFLSLHIVLPLVIAIAAIGGVGAYVLIKNSHAASSLTSSGCYLRGRVWTGSSCSKTCISGAGSHVVASPYDYCSGAVSKISYSTCVSKNRKWVDSGCARRWQQTKLAGAHQCTSSSMTYYVENTYDRCATLTQTVAPTYSCPSNYRLIAVSNAKIQTPTSIDIIDGRTCETTASNPGTVMPQYWYVKPTKS